MWHDPIVDEVRRARDEYARQFDYDLEAILRDIQRRQSVHGDNLVRRAPRTTEPAPNSATEQTNSGTTV